MLKHKFVIDRLSEAQKIKILADVRCLANDEYAKLGAPSFKLSEIEGYRQSVYPSCKALANSWDLKVISDVAGDVALGMIADGINVADIPSPVAKLNIHDSAISEDPYFSSRVVAEYASAIEKRGLGIVVNGVDIDANGVSKLDKKPNWRFVNEFIINPIKSAVENKRCNGITVSSDVDVKYYETFNSDISDKITVGEQRSYQGSYILCKNIAPEDTVARIIKGHICFDGSETVLKAAIDKYRRLKSNIDKGRVSVCELEAEIENGSAFPTEKIDEALDRVFEFVYECTRDYKGKATSFTPNATLIKNACYESTVLLKNKNNILPLKTGTMAALVGDILVNYNGEDVDNSDTASNIAYYLRNQGCTPTGFYRGYSMHADRSNRLLSELHAEASNVETILFFMGTNPQREAQMMRARNLCLPANQLAALNMLHGMGKRIIAVVSSDLAFDANFDSLVDALIVAPLNTKYGAEAAIDIIMGKAMPVGRLASTIYRDTEHIEKKQSYYLSLPNARVGTFLGYRYYDTADFDVAYPFGFGLSYSNLQYSNISVRGNDVVFTVKNKGKSVATEVVQLYVGLNSSKRLRPKKELVGFERITLEAGGSMTVRMPLNNLERFDEVSGEWACEQGEYRVYVGSSVRDIKLVGKALLGNARLEGVNERASDYLQSKTNIISDRYTLEADYKLMKRNVRNIVFGVGSLCLSIAMFLFSLLSGSVAIFFIVIAAILAVVGVVFFILEGCDRSKLHKAEREMIDKANKDSFKDAEEIVGFSAEFVFDEEFGVAGDSIKKSQTPVQVKADNYLEYVNDELTFKVAAMQFNSFAASRGYRFDENSVDEIFAAMSASRLIITKGMTNDSFAAFIKILSEYFGTEAGIDVVDHTYTNDNNALFKQFGTTKQKTALACAIERSCEAKERVHIAALTDVNFAGISNYFVPFSRYIRNPRNATVIEAVNEVGDSVSFKPFENLWFFVNLRMGETLRSIPAYISELASVIKVDYSATVPTRANADILQFNYYQFDYMLDKVKANNGIPEETWKKIDSLEEFIKSNAPFVLSNRCCIAIEKFYAVYSACGGEAKDALDRALSARVIPSAVVVLNEIENTDNKNLSEKLEMIFGEDNIEASRSAIRASGTTVL